MTSLLRRRTVQPFVRVTVRMSCGASYTMTAATSAAAFEFVDKLTDPRPGFTTIPADLDDAGTERRLNRGQVTSVAVTGLPADSQ